MARKQRKEGAVPAANQGKPSPGPVQDFSRILVETIRDYAIVILDTDGRVVSWNPGAEAIKGYTAKEMIGRHFSCFYTPEDIEAGKPELELKEAEATGRFEDEGWRVRKGGERFWANVVFTPLRDARGKLCGYGKITRDLTERKRMEEAMAAQASEIMEISTPVVQVWQGVVAATLIGTLDSQRAARATETLLQRIVETRSTVALLDITGVPTIDTKTAQHLIETISAVRLLGGQAVITGIRPAIAQTLVHLGLDLAGVITRSTLAAGLLVALDHLNLKVVEK
jgi:PAS domain S-box-containing protein